MTTPTDLMNLVRHPRPKARQEGADAYRGGQSKSENPYDAGTPEHAGWNAGWDYELDQDS